jgi:glycosyltransferase involved in cell wall biosynthesis
MKILIVNTYDIEGGAARASYRLHQALLGSDINSQMLVQSKASDDYEILGAGSRIQEGFAEMRPALDSLPVRIYKKRTKTLFSPNWLPFSKIVDRINKINPDIVHLHWISDGMMRIDDVAKISMPIIWSLHDMWAFTGGCHYDESCGNYKNTCGNCIVLGSHKSHDLSSKIYARKYKSFSSIANLNIIGLSRWLTTAAQESSLFNQRSVYNLPNPIDTKTFAPMDKRTARDLFNLPQDKRLVLFGAMNALSDPRKGFKELSASLEQINDENIALVVFGSSQPKVPQKFKQKVHYLGLLHDDVSLCVLYSAADAMVVPSLQENLSNAIMESLACSTPVVGFNVGGNCDMIEHQINGYLAQPFDVADLAKGIEWILNSPDYEVLSKNARNKIMREFDSKIVVKKYISLYHSILNKDRPFSVTQA